MGQSTQPVPATRPTAEKSRLAVIDFRTDGKVEKTGGTTIAAFVRQEVQQSDLFELMDREMMKERLDEKDFAATSECDQVKCLVRYGKTLDVQKIIGGFASSFGEAWVLNIRLVDVNTGREERTFSRELTGQMHDLLKLAREGTRELIGLGQASRTAPDKGEKTITLDCGNGVKLELVRIPAGEFMMGSPESEADRYLDEGPQHQVKISKAFYLGKYEVTQAQWQAVMGNNPSRFKGAVLPVENVSWDDAQAFCRKLTEKAGKAVRLPTEAEWEYACRASSSTCYSFGSGEFDLANYAWYSANSTNSTHPVGGKWANAFGLYDMHGNVWEWCEDWYGKYECPVGATRTDPTGPTEGDTRVLRGGDWGNTPIDCRSAYRFDYTPSIRGINIGFRCAARTP